MPKGLYFCLYSPKIKVGHRQFESQPGQQGLGNIRTNNGQADCTQVY